MRSKVGTHSHRNDKDQANSIVKRMNGSTRAKEKEKIKRYCPRANATRDR